jgi:hypothetical protein
MARKTVTVTRRVTVAAPASEVWRLIGDFHGLDRWHPAVAKSEPARIGADEFRTLTTRDGARILEHLVARNTHSCTYAIVRSPLPVAHYEARLEAATAGKGTEVTWSGSFTPTAENAEKVIAGIYEAGLNALKQRFGG